MLKFGFGILLAVACMGILLNYAALDYKLYSNIEITYIPVLLLMPMVVHLLQAELFRVALRFFGVSIVWLPSFLLTVSNTFLNLVAPMQTASVLRALYMKRYLKVDISKFIGAMASAQFGAWIVGGGGVALLLLIDDGLIRPFLSVLSFPWYYFAPVVLLALLAAWWVFDGASVLKHLLARLGLTEFPSVAEVLALGAIRTWLCGCSVISMWLISLLMSNELDFLPLLFITLIASMLVFVVITPGNIGVFEAVMYFLAKTFGLDEEVVLLCVILDRFIFYSIAAGLSVFSAFYLKRFAA
ncbi:YbhN family protein [uncultured Pseudoteredinibacter sp.]|uniref:lysylphosphatidylglycerol synthase transmembrane domain-containing protein n=1 Tax=uncultured Pseudoteredinibacter sp. TaxID=1641701 RepID=UPI002626AEE5|nr:YbhN family protein [uncultured Pseudoteredinibacter sp.]